MRTVVLEIEDNKFEQFMGLINLLKSDVVKHFEVKKSTVDLASDPMAQELKRRIQEINDGTVTLTPFQEGMDAMMQSLRIKYASA